MKIMSLKDEICKYLENLGFNSVSQKDYRIQIYLKDNVSVKVEEREKKEGD